MNRAPIVFLALLALGSMIGCSGDAEVSKTEDKTIRNNFSRALTPEEVAQMGNKTDGAARPERTPQ